MIEKAFIELLQEKGFQSITVQDITDRAMVNRATFYDHFTDKYALVEHSMRTWFQQTLESKLPADLRYCPSNLGLLIETLGEFLGQVGDHCRTRNADGLPSFDEQVVDVVSELLSKWIQDHGRLTGSSDLIVAVASWAMYGAARHWSRQKPRESIKDFAMRTAPMISALIDQDETTAAV
ncbi:MAG: TetR family transcriptional regulator [Anaerolineae bacterium]